MFNKGRYFTTRRGGRSISLRACVAGFGGWRSDGRRDPLEVARTQPAVCYGQSRGWTWGYSRTFESAYLSTGGCLRWRQSRPRLRSTSCVTVAAAADALLGADRGQGHRPGYVARSLADSTGPGAAGPVFRRAGDRMGARSCTRRGPRKQDRFCGTTAHRQGRQPTSRPTGGAYGTPGLRPGRLTPADPDHHVLRLADHPHRVWR